MPTYDDAAALKAATDELRRCPPLIFAGEVRRAVEPPARLLSTCTEVGFGSHGRRCSAGAVGRANDAACRAKQSQRLVCPSDWGGRAPPSLTANPLGRHPAGARPAPQPREGGERRGVPPSGEQSRNHGLIAAGGEETGRLRSLDNEQHATEAARPRAGARVPADTLTEPLGARDELRSPVGARHPSPWCPSCLPRQGGDCAEGFKEFNTNHIRDTVRLQPLISSG